MVSFCVSVKPWGNAEELARMGDELAVAVAVGSESTVGYTDDGVESVFGKVDRAKVTVDGWPGRMGGSKLLMEQAGSTL